jgi:predicted ATPase/DNA-binding SARP family transcriptional activator
MSNTLEVFLLGALRVSYADNQLVCASRKAMWMAAYVLMQGAPQMRHDLARLFWADVEISRALGSLRVALTRLPRPVVDCLDVRRDLIGVSPEVKPWIDVDEFATLCRSDDLHSLQRAVALYRGDLLLDGDEGEAPEFFDWVRIERNRLRGMAHATHLLCAEKLRAKGDALAANEVANSWLARDPADEAMNRLLMTWLAKDVGNDRALAQYDTYRSALAVSRGAAPSPMMAALAEKLQHRGVSVPAPDARLAAGTALIGREAEIKDLKAILADPACRLLTLLGMGGVGKTRLALALAEAMGADFGDGVFIVGLEDVATPSLFAQTVARACGLQPAGSGNPVELLISFFRRRHALLVLDNLEHLLAADHRLASDMSVLLAGTGSRLKVLATSREPVRLQEEWLHRLDGLSHPGVESDSESQSCAAVDLFVSRARQADPRFSSNGQLRDVADICALLEGLPLGIELAAGWVGEVGVASLGLALRTEAARLQSVHINRPPRQRSLGAVVAYSWERLSEELRQVLSALAVLSGTFSGEAAGHIASASESSLVALAARSLLKQQDGGRWHMHEVVRQFAWDACAGMPARQDAVQLRRDQYYLDWLRSLRQRIDGVDEAGAMREIDLEAANVRAAWQSRAHLGADGNLAAAAEVWFDYLECRSFFIEGMAAAESWLLAARENGTATAQALYYLGLFRRLAGRTTEARNALDEALLAFGTPMTEGHAQVLAARAFTHLLQGDLVTAEQDAVEAYRVAEVFYKPALTAAACRVLGQVLLQTGRREEGRSQQQRALTLAERTGRPSLLAAAHNNLAMAENHLGNHDAAESGYLRALAAWRGLQATGNIGRAQHNLGVVATRKGEHALALERYREALETLRRVDDRNLMALNLMSTGDALLRLGRPREALESAGQALEMAERDGHLLPALDARVVLAQACIETADPMGAARHLLRALEAIGSHRFPNVRADIVVTAARLVSEVAPLHLDAAQRWAHATSRLEEISPTIRKEAANFLATRAGNGSEEHFEMQILDVICQEAHVVLRNLTGETP